MKKLHALQFDWDQWNIQKNELKHGISSVEAESVFFDNHLVIYDDLKHSTQKESRWIGYGTSQKHHILMIAFTIRMNRIRIISARVASSQERKVYETNKKETH